MLLFFIAGLNQTDIMEFLESVGHRDLRENPEGLNVVNTVLKINETVYAQSDNRNGGEAAFY